MIRVDTRGLSTPVSRRGHYVPRVVNPGLHTSVTSTRRPSSWTWYRRCCAADPERPSTPPSQPTETDVADDAFDGLTKEEDWVVSGSNLGSLSQNTELGRAVDGACDELGHLGSLEADVLQEADKILKKFGFKPAVLQPPLEGDGDEHSKA
jgi:hypothetical protein